MSEAITQLLSGLAAIATPVLLAVFGFVLSRQLNRNSELMRLRVEYYKARAPDLNTLMCYVTFIGTWPDHSPEEIIKLKRKLDATAHSALPHLTPEVAQAYKNFMDACFQPFGEWGRDALICSGAYQRRRYWRRDDQPWSRTWDAMFTKADAEPITAEELKGIRGRYDTLLDAFVEDLKVAKARTQYTTDEVTINAYYPEPADVPGALPEEPDSDPPTRPEVRPFHSMARDPNSSDG